MKTVKFLQLLCFAVVISFLLPALAAAQGKDVTNQTPKSAVQVPPVQPGNYGAEQLPDDRGIAKNNNNERYRIGYQDTLAIVVTGHDELSQVVSVSPDGTISMRYINQPIVAVCKTEQELKTTIESLYKNSLLRNPYVTVRSVDQKSQPFAVIGAVKNPGSFFLNRKIQLLSLLSLAGGPDVEKSGSKVRVARVGNVSSCEENLDSAEVDKAVQFFTYNIKDVQDGKDNPWMQPGDVVTVLDAEEAYVVGNVFKPAKISLKEPKTLTQAIASAGGLDATARTDKVIIQRQEPGQINKTELTYNLQDIRTKKIADPQLQANDIVEVSNDKIKSVRSGVLKALTGGLGNIFLRVPAP